MKWIETVGVKLRIYMWISRKELSMTFHHLISVSVIMVYLVIPCVIINAFQVKYTPEIQKGLILVCVAAIAVHIFWAQLQLIIYHLSMYLENDIILYK